MGYVHEKKLWYITPWYKRNDDIHRDLHMIKVSEEIKNSAVNHVNHIHNHKNASLRNLLVINYI